MASNEKRFDHYLRKIMEIIQLNSIAPGKMKKLEKLAIKHPIDYKKKAMGGPIKKKYARGGGIRKTKKGKK